MYLHWRVIRMEEKAKRILRDLFDAYMSRNEQIPHEFRERAEKSTTSARLVCDYLAGMTDRFALDEHKRFFDPHERV
jgi:dGTPase